jgi:hypothetical protein
LVVVAVTLRVLSLGAGVQSTTLALMAARGDIPPPDYAIFADTGWEPAATYRHLDWLEAQLSYPLIRVSAGNIRADIEARASARSGRFASVPWWVRGADGRAAPVRRQCTAHYKLEPIMRECRRLLGLAPRQRAPVGAVTMLIGISTDEAARMRPARVRYIVNTWPLIDAGMSRRDCLRWLAERQYPEPPKSACIGCPFHSDAMWRDMRDNRPEEWADALAADALIRDAGTRRGMASQQFMHRSLLPLDQVDLRTRAEKGEPDLFQMECEGMCGV